MEIEAIVEKQQGIININLHLLCITGIQLEKKSKLDFVAGVSKLKCEDEKNYRFKSIFTVNF